MRRCASAQVQPKVKNYHNDGTGRDSYISRFNGGQMTDRLINELKPQATLEHEKMHFLTPSAKNVTRNNPPQLPIKTSKYWGDGSGRDYFVIQNDGGQSIPYRWQDRPDLVFASSLRAYPKIYQRIKSAGTWQRNELAKPKKQVRVETRPHTPNIKEAHRIYRSYQTLQYQSKAKNIRYKYE